MTFGRPVFPGTRHDRQHGYDRLTDRNVDARSGVSSVSCLSGVVDHGPELEIGVVCPTTVSMTQLLADYDGSSAFSDWACFCFCFFSASLSRASVNRSIM